MSLNPLPVASGTTILGIWLIVGCGAAALLRSAGCPDEATVLLSGVAAGIGMIAHPQVNRSVPVSPEPPNEPLAGTSVGDRLG